MNYWDQFAAVWVESAEFWLKIIAVVVILVGAGLGLLGVFATIAAYGKYGLRGALAGIVIGLIGIAVLVFGIPFVNWLAVVWGVVA